MPHRSAIATQLNAYYPRELLELYKRGERDFAACNLLREELEASFDATRRFEQAQPRPGERPTSPLWLGRLFRGDPDFDFDHTGRVVSLEIDDSPAERNLAGADLRDIRLEGAYVYPVDLSRAKLSASNLKRAVFIDCSFRGADLSRCDLRDARFRSCDLRDANFYMARMDRCEFSDCRAERVRLTRAKLKKAIFVGVNLRRADLSGYFDRTDLLSCDLRHADLTGVDLRYGVFYQNRVGASQVGAVITTLRIDVDSRV